MPWLRVMGQHGFTHIPGLMTSLHLGADGDTSLLLTSAWSVQERSLARKQPLSSHKLHPILAPSMVAAVKNLA